MWAEVGKKACFYVHKGWQGRAQARWADVAAAWTCRLTEIGREHEQVGLWVGIEEG